MSRSKRGTCYICGDPGTSAEHVPARAFFPSRAEYRRNLITVPSCKTHNQDTSPDDEYVRNVIAMSYGANATTFGEFFGKLVRSLENSPGLFQSTFGTRIPVATSAGPSFAFQIKRPRLERVMRKIAYGVYYHERKQPWLTELIVATDSLTNADMSADDLGVLAALANRFTQYDLASGANPSVFQYRLLQDIGQAILQLTFYDAFRVWLTPLEGSSTPSLDTPSTAA